MSDKFPETSITIKQAGDYVRSMLRAEAKYLTIFCEGRPGTAKSSFPLEIAAEEEIPCVILKDLHTMDVCDLRGLPWKSADGKHTEWLPPRFFGDLDDANLPEVGIVVVEELPQAPAEVQKAIAPLLLDHRLGHITLPPRWVVIANGNAVKDRSGASRLFAHVKDRMCYFRTSLPVKDWVQKGTVEGFRNPDGSRTFLCMEVAAFANFKQEGIFHFEASNEHQNATPRSYTKLSEVFPHMPKESRLMGTYGYIGKMASEFLGFCDYFLQWSEGKIESILANPGEFNVKELSAQQKWTLAGTISEMSVGLSKDQLESAICFVDRLGRELSMFSIIQMKNKHGGIAKLRQRGTKAMEKWLDKNKDFLCEAVANSK